jgi:hypothetical protein
MFAFNSLSLFGITCCVGTFEVTSNALEKLNPAGATLDEWIRILVSYVLFDLFSAKHVLVSFPFNLNVLRSARYLNHLTDRRQVSKLDQFVTAHAA